MRGEGTQKWFGPALKITSRVILEGAEKQRGEDINMYGG